MREDLFEGGIGNPDQSFDPIVHLQDEKETARKPDIFSPFPGAADVTVASYQRSTRQESA